MPRPKSIKPTSKDISQESHQDNQPQITPELEISEGAEAISQPKKQTKSKTKLGSKPWSKHLRLSVFVMIYQTIFNQPRTSRNSSSIQDLEMDSQRIDSLLLSLLQEHPEYFGGNTLGSDPELALELNDEFWTDLRLLVQAQVDSFVANYSDYKTQLEPYLTNWDRTFEIIKAILFCFILELRNAKSSLNEQQITTLIGSYIQLTEDFSVPANVKLVHAILAKLVV